MKALLYMGKARVPHDATVVKKFPNSKFCFLEVTVNWHGNLFKMPFTLDGNVRVFAHSHYAPIPDTMLPVLFDMNTLKE